MNDIIFTQSNVLNGRATVLRGNRPEYTNPTGCIAGGSFIEAIPSGEAEGRLSYLDARYDQGPSGTWEG